MATIYFKKLNQKNDKFKNQKPKAVPEKVKCNIVELNFYPV